MQTRKGYLKKSENSPITFLGRIDIENGCGWYPHPNRFSELINSYEFDIDSDVDGHIQDTNILILVHFV